MRTDLHVNKILVLFIIIRDGDGHQDNKDNCPDTINSSQLDTDKDGMVPYLFFPTVARLEKRVFILVQVLFSTGRRV